VKGVCCYHTPQLTPPNILCDIHDRVCWPTYTTTYPVFY
jgi:hypothetical protein